MQGRYVPVNLDLSLRTFLTGKFPCKRHQMRVTNVPLPWGLKDSDGPENVDSGLWCPENSRHLRCQQTQETPLVLTYVEVAKVGISWNECCLSIFLLCLINSQRGSVGERRHLVYINYVRQHMKHQEWLGLCKLGCNVRNKRGKMPSNKADHHWESQTR